MAHKLAHRLQSMGDEPRDNGRDESGSTGVTRRGYVRLGGAALATITALTGKIGAVAATSTDDASGPEHRIRIRGTDTPSTYEVTVGGEFVVDAATGRTGGQVSGSTAEGAVTSDDRTYRFRGELRDVTVDGDAAVSLDGEAFEP